MTSRLEKYLSNELYTRFGQYSIRQNYRPDWMEGLELDFYIDELKLAAEVQGQQHYGFVEYFHRTLENFEAQKQRDEKKRFICRDRKINLFEIFTEKDADLFVQEVKIMTIQNTPKYFYQDQTPNELKTRKKIVEKFSGLKEKLRKKNDPDQVAERLERTKENIEKYERGEILATKEKYIFWKMILENNGIMDIEKEYKRVIDEEVKKAFGFKY